MGLTKNEAGLTRRRCDDATMLTMRGTKECAQLYFDSYMAMMASQLQHGLSNIAYCHQLQQRFDFLTF